MKPRYFLLAFLLLTFLSRHAEASTLFGRVIEINDGDVITVFNLNRPVRIKLLAVDAPEAGQPFGDVARKHLSDLVYDKSVLVEYWGIAADGSLVGRVTLNSADVGAQMIRDGAAWFDTSNQGRLSVVDREVYQQSEQAARAERRGLWQAENPIAPWEFVRAQALRRNPAASLNSILPAAGIRANRPTPELTNLTLLTERVTAGAAPSVNDPDLAWASSSARKNWQRFKPAGQSFSALVPDDGQQKTITVPIGNRVVDINVYAARDGWAFYALMWVTAPSNGESDKVAIDGTLRAFMRGFGDGYQRRNNSAFSCELGEDRSFSAAGYSVSEYDLSTCTVPAKLRAFTRVVGADRQMYLGAVFYASADDENISRFMQSFTVGTSAVNAKRSRARSGH
ncbi:MAG TPA: thermonuclease family protein [Pyrinomonadaceae bacterium]|jgi:endonuclease YncB( thermonuclease family)